MNDRPPTGIFRRDQNGGRASALLVSGFNYIDTCLLLRERALFNPPVPGVAPDAPRLRNPDEFVQATAREPEPADIGLCAVLDICKPRALVSLRPQHVFRSNAKALEICFDIGD